MRKMLTAIILSLFFFTPAGAAHLDLAWNANTEPDLAGYRVYYGTGSRDYGGIGYIMERGPGTMGAYRCWE